MLTLALSLTLTLTLTLSRGEAESLRELAAKEQAMADDATRAAEREKVAVC